MWLSLKMFQNRLRLLASHTSSKNPVNLCLMLYILKYKLRFFFKETLEVSLTVFMAELKIDLSVSDSQFWPPFLGCEKGKKECSGLKVTNEIWGVIEMAIFVYNSTHRETEGKMAKYYFVFYVSLKILWELVMTWQSRSHSIVRHWINIHFLNIRGTLASPIMTVETHMRNKWFTLVKYVQQKKSREAMTEWSKNT